MRKLAIVGAAVLALAVVTPVFAATPASASSHAAAATTHTWRATASHGKTRATSRLSLNSTVSGGVFSITIKGAAPKTRATAALLIGPCGGKTDVMVTSFQRKTSASGVAAGAVNLSKAQAAQVEAAVKAGTKLSSTVTDGSLHLCGAFSG